MKFKNLPLLINPWVINILVAANGTAIGRKRTCQYQQKENPVLSTLGDKLLLVTTEPSRCRLNNQDL